MSKIIKSGTAQAPVYTESETTLIDGIMLGVTAPFAVLQDSSNEFYSKNTVAVAALTDLAVGFVAGDKFGASVPVLGQRRI